jgi:cytochrome c oxidase assembly protein Cox11
MFYNFQDKHKLLEGNLEFKEHKYMFDSYEMVLYNAVVTPGAFSIAARAVATAAVIQIAAYFHSVSCYCCC